MQLIFNDNGGNCMATIQIRVDDKMKAAADSLFNSLGLDTSTAARIFFTAAIENDGFPFEIRRVKEHAPNAEQKDNTVLHKRRAYEKTMREAAADKAFIARTMETQREFAVADAEVEDAW
jgi:DNA-damage-inducible protein J